MSSAFFSLAFSFDAAAAPNHDRTKMAQFNGTWALNQAKSDSTDELLTAQGVGWIKRKVNKLKK